MVAAADDGHWRRKKGNPLHQLWISRRHRHDDDDDPDAVATDAATTRRAPSSGGLGTQIKQHKEDGGKEANSSSSGGYLSKRYLSAMPRKRPQWQARYTFTMTTNGAARNFWNGRGKSQ